MSNKLRNILFAAIIATIGFYTYQTKAPNIKSKWVITPEVEYRPVNEILKGFNEKTLNDPKTQERILELRIDEFWIKIKKDDDLKNYLEDIDFLFSEITEKSQEYNFPQKTTRSLYENLFDASDTIVSRRISLPNDLSPYRNKVALRELEVYCNEIEILFQPKGFESRGCRDLENIK
jgi:hypothetical protein